MSAPTDRGRHRDWMGRLWTTQQLDTLLSDPEVYVSAAGLLSVGLQPCGSFHRSYALDIARLRYSRPEPAALLTTLAQRLWWIRQEMRDSQ